MKGESKTRKSVGGGDQRDQIRRWRLVKDRRGGKSVYRDNVDQGGLSGALEADQGQLHLLFPEQLSEEFYDGVEEGLEHFHRG